MHKKVLSDNKSLNLFFVADSSNPSEWREVKHQIKIESERSRKGLGKSNIVSDGLSSRKHLGIHVQPLRISNFDNAIDGQSSQKVKETFEVYSNMSGADKVTISDYHTPRSRTDKEAATCGCSLL